MALPILHWRKLARGSLLTVTNPITEVLDAIADQVIGDAFYYDGSTPRVVGSGNAVVGPARDGTTNALYWGHQAGGAKTVIGGLPSGDAAPMGAPDSGTLGANILGVNVVRNAGAYVAWQNANAFDAGTPMGFWRAANLGGTGVTYQWDFYECGEATMLVIGNVVDVPHGFLAGMLLDPISSAPLDAYPDGRLLGMATAYNYFSQDGNIIWSINELIAPNWNAFADHHTSNGNNHHGVLPPTGGRWYTDKSMVMRRTNEDTFWRTPGDRLIFMGGVPFHLMDDYRFVGLSRQWGIVTRAPPGSVFQSGGVDKAYAAGAGHWTINRETVGLAA